LGRKYWKEGNWRIWGEWKDRMEMGMDRMLGEEIMGLVFLGDKIGLDS
jgi:hypothetical protein